MELALPWMLNILDIIKGPPSTRFCYNILDDVGTHGKSTFATYLHDFHGAFLAEGKLNDIAPNYEYEKVVVFDVERDCESDFDPKAVQAFLNGRYHVAKWSRGYERFPIPHVFIFSNIPVLRRISKNKVRVIDISGDPQYEV
jgi:hypothetical protein